ncbi:unnamed protein product [Enterobius vermicularis]|uniref:ANK_REP_REGION domain-containing protein n=1 Tax=Enterobius vermicularis TaxID=51028 RepID=A0A0N4V246_ENTVE|nr:unnamed protein product [Enterobius vermicularis]
METSYNKQLFECAFECAEQGDLNSLRHFLSCYFSAGVKRQKVLDKLLLLASRNDDFELAQFSITNGANVNVSGKYKNTPLLTTCYNGHGKVAKLLIEEGADLNQTPLWVASYNGFVQIAKLLLENGAEVGEKDLLERTALYAASANGHFEVVRYLVEMGAEINEKSRFGRTSLWAACDKGHIVVVQYLVENGAEINTVDLFGKTPLSAAFEGRYIEVVNYLVETGADVSKANLFREPSIMAWNSRKGSSQEVTAKQIRPAGLSIVPSTITQYVQLGQSYPLPVQPFTVVSKRSEWKQGTEAQLLSLTGNVSLMAYFARNWRRKNEKCLLPRAFSHGTAKVSYIEMCSWWPEILRAFARTLSVDTPTYKGSVVRLFKAAPFAITDGLDMKIKGASMKITAHPDYPVKYSGNITILVPLDLRRTLTKPPAFCLYVEEEKKMEKYFVKYRHDTYTKNILTVLACVISLRPISPEISGTHSSRLDNRVVQAQPDKKMKHKIEVQENLLYEASEKGDIKTVKYLLKNGVDVDKVFELGKTALYIASEYGNTKVVKCLVEYGANVNVKALSGLTPLWAASKNGHVEVVRYLVKNKADANIKGISGETPLRVASENGYVEVVKCLLENGANINGKNRLGETPIIAAARKGHIKVVKYLVQNGIDIDRVETAQKITPLQAASENGHLETVKYLVERGADITKGTPLRLAAGKGHIRVVEYLVRKGADVNKVTKLN